MSSRSTAICLTATSALLTSALLTLAALTAAAAPAHAAGGAVTASVRVTRGSLSLHTAAAPGGLTVRISDARGTGLGWTAMMTVSGVSARVGRCVRVLPRSVAAIDPSSSAASNMQLGAAQALGEGQTALIVHAARGQGMGSYTVRVGIVQDEACRQTHMTVSVTLI